MVSFKALELEEEGDFSEDFTLLDEAGTISMPESLWLESRSMTEVIFLLLDPEDDECDFDFLDPISWSLFLSRKWSRFRFLEPLSLLESRRRLSSSLKLLLMSLNLALLDRISSEEGSLSPSGMISKPAGFFKLKMLDEAASIDEDTGVIETEGLMSAVVDLTFSPLREDDDEEEDPVLAFDKGFSFKALISRLVENLVAGS